MFEYDLYEDEDFSNCIVDLHDINKKKFIACNFSNADLSDVSVIYGCTFDKCNFLSTELNGVDIRSSVFSNCKFKYVNLFTTKFDECKMTGSSFIECDFSLLSIIGGDWSYTELRYLDFDKKDLNGVNFTGADLTGTNMTRCKIKECNFQEIVADKMSFRDSDIRTSTIDHMDILSVNLKNTKVDIPQCIAIAEAIGAKYKP